MENRKKLFLISGILVVLIVAGGIIWFLSRTKKNEALLPQPGIESITTTETIDTVPATIVITTTTPSPELDAFQAQVELLAATDQDLDGLSDTEEKTYGTSPANSDTDADGLLDKDEILIFHTDPLKADTDADTHPDGEEVRNGYNPSGSGKLETL